MTRMGPLYAACVTPRLAPMDSALRNRSGRATFLCYHSVADRGPRFLTVSPDLFERQLATLKRRGIHGGGLVDLHDIAAGGDGPPTVFLTFDDGFRDNHTTVLPLLREYGFSAFCFVLPPLVDDGLPLAWPEVATDAGRSPETMVSVTWPMVEEMVAGGFEIGSHTLTHPHLSRLDPERLREELWESRRQIAGRLGSCDTLAYPFGDWSPAVAEAARDCGYTYAFTLPTGVGQRDAEALSIPRINVDVRDDAERFRMKLAPLGKRLFLSPAIGPLRRGTKRLRGG
jgi:peptidoglycan/xylan/chitin deacetylase (PgdA/CDA1 family)